MKVCKTFVVIVLWTWKPASADAAVQLVEGQICIHNPHFLGGREYPRG